MLPYPRPIRTASGGHRALVAALAVILVANALLTTDLGVSAQGGTAAPPTADLVIDFGDGRTVTRQLAVDPPTTGLDFLLASSLDVRTDGGAVCAIDGVGCPTGACFCDPKRYWGYFHGQADGGWHYAEEGAGDYTVSAGATEGWAWGEGQPPGTTGSQAASGPALAGTGPVDVTPRPSGTETGPPASADTAQVPPATAVATAAAPGPPMAAGRWPYLALGLVVGALAVGLLVLRRRGDAAGR